MFTSKQQKSAPINLRSKIEVSGPQVNSRGRLDGRLGMGIDIGSGAGAAQAFQDRSSVARRPIDATLGKLYGFSCPRRARARSEQLERVVIGEEL